jgi:hypothetical protein
LRAWDVGYKIEGLIEREKKVNLKSQPRRVRAFGGGLVQGVQSKLAKKDMTKIQKQKRPKKTKIPHKLIPGNESAHFK